jgi:hypothetical protein
VSLRLTMLCHSEQPITFLPGQWAICGIDLDGLDVPMLVRGYGAYSNHGSDGVSICGGAWRVGSGGGWPWG